MEPTPPAHLGTPNYLTHSGVPPQLPQDKSTAVWEVHVADGEGRHSTRAVEEAILSSLPHLVQELPFGATDARGVPNSQPDPLSGSAPETGREEARPSPQRSAPRPAGPPTPRVRPRGASPALTAEPRPDTRPQTPETLSARNPFSPPAGPAPPPSQTPRPRPPRLWPGTPPPPPLTASSRHPSPPAPALPARPTQARRAPQLFPGRGPGPAAAGLPRLEPQQPGGRASPWPLPAQRARVALGTRSAFGPRRSARAAGPAWREPRCPGARTPVQRRVPAPAPPPRSAHLRPRRRRHCREDVAVAAAARAPRLASPLLSSPRPRSCLRSAGPQRQAPSAAGKPHLLALTLTPRRPRGAPAALAALAFPSLASPAPCPGPALHSLPEPRDPDPARPAPGSPLAASGEPAPTTELLSASSPGSRAAGARSHPWVIPG